jgi:hypothetical protein
MNFIEINKRNMAQAIAAVPVDTPIFMLNLLKYKAKATYKHNAVASFITGQEAYLNGYIPAFNSIAANIPGIQPVYIGSPIASLVAPAGETWHTIALIEYPNFGAFRAVVDHPDYAVTAEPHRLAALEDWRLLVTVKISLS